MKSKFIVWFDLLKSVFEAIFTWRSKHDEWFQERARKRAERDAKDEEAFKSMIAEERALRGKD